MGTRGYRVYRHRGYYIIHYNHCDSYPSGLGYDMASQVPSDPDEYRQWLQDMKTSLDQMLALKQAETDVYPKIMFEPPWLDIFIEWIYELDFDHEVFLVNNSPVFDLRNMPRELDVFTESIGEDSYGYTGYSSSTPEAHRFSSWRVPPPIIAPSAIDQYESHNIRCKDLTSQELFRKLKTTRDLEEVCIRFLEVLVGSAMKSSEYCLLLRQVGCIPDFSEIPESLTDLGSFLVGCAVKSGIHEEIFPVDGNSTVWLCSSVCLRMATHLTDIDVSRAAIANILDSVADRPDSTGVIYGLVFSFLHCLIVRVDVKTWTIDHTQALPFLPSFYGNTPSTPGITAVARIGCLVDPLVELGVAPLRTNSLNRDLPYEIWSQIADHLSSVDELASMGHISPACWSVVNARLRYPRVGPYWLRSVRKAQEPESSSNQLWTAQFNATNNKGTQVLELTPRRHLRSGFSVPGNSTSYRLDYIQIPHA